LPDTRMICDGRLETIETIETIVALIGPRAHAHTYTHGALCRMCVSIVSIVSIVSSKCAATSPPARVLPGMGRIAGTLSLVI
jgi:hypothetical protein